MDNPTELQATMVDDALLRRWPLPLSNHKEESGHLLAIVGSCETPGAAILAGTAALRAGAARLTIATAASIAQPVAFSIPESRVLALPETPGGGIAPTAVDAILAAASRCNAVLIGPGLQDEQATCALILALLPRLPNTRLLLDACAMNVVRRQLQAVDASNHHGQQKFVTRFPAPVLLMPHVAQLAHLAALDMHAVHADPADAAGQAARRWNALVALKGACTIIAAPDGRSWRHEGNDVCLSVAGAADSLSGIVAGLAARGASLEQASVWGVALQAQAIARLVQRQGPVGYLAREIAGEVPMLMQSHGQG